MRVSLKKVLLFIFLSYAFSWIIAVSYYALGGAWQSTSGMLVGILIMFAPLAATLVVQKWLFKQPVIRPLRVSFSLNRWFLVAWLVPPLVALLAFAFALLIPGISYAPDMAGLWASLKEVLPPEQIAQMQEEQFPVHFFWIALVQALVAGATINTLAAFGEELGWRGFLLKELAPLGFWKASIIIGIAWGFWHAPVIYLFGHNYPNYPVLGIFLMTIATMFLGPLFSYVTIRARSVIAAAIMHGTFNASYGLSVMLLLGGNELLVGSLGLVGIITLAALNVIVYLYERYQVGEPINVAYAKLFQDATDNRV